MENNESANSAPVLDESTSQVEESQTETSEAEEALVEATAEAPAAVKEEKKAANKRKLKLKVDGQELEEEFDLDNEEELIKQFQLAKVAQKRMQEHSTLKKQVEELAKVLKTSPEKVMKELGMDPEEWAINLLNKKIEDEAKSPEQKEREKLQQELEELRSKQKEEDESRKKQEFERLQREYEEKYQNDIMSALDTGGLPKTPYAVKKFAEMLSIALDNNLDISAKELVPIVKKELEEDIRQVLASSPDDAIEQLLGKERISSMRKKHVAAVKKQVASTSDIKATGSQPASKEKEASKADKIRISDFLRS